MRPLHFHPLPRPARWKRALLLAPPLLGLFYVAVAEPNARSLAKGIGHEILAALNDPLALFSQRSPGWRIAGRLLSTKGKSGPHERVLSTVRDRETPEIADNAIPNSVATIPIIPPQYDVPPTDQVIGALPFLPPVPFMPTGFIPGGTPNPPGLPPGPPGGPNPPGPPGPPGEPNPPGPPGGPNPPGPPDTSPPDKPPIIPIPEPSTWTLLLFGLLVVAAVRRKPSAGA